MQAIKVKKDQSLADIALQEYGHVEGVFLLVEDNPQLIGITDNVFAGDELLVRAENINSPMKIYLTDYDIATVKGGRGEGIGYWNIKKDFIIES